MQYLLIKLEASLGAALHLYSTSLLATHGQRFFALVCYGIVPVYMYHSLTYLRQIVYFVERIPTELTFTQIETRLNRKDD
jgi:hypothetical protein